MTAAMSFFCNDPFFVLILCLTVELTVADGVIISASPTRVSALLLIKAEDMIFADLVAKG